MCSVATTSVRYLNTSYSIFDKEDLIHEALVAIMLDISKCRKRNVNCSLQYLYYIGYNAALHILKHKEQTNFDYDIAIKPIDQDIITDAKQLLSDIQYAILSDRYGLDGQKSINFSKICTKYNLSFYMVRKFFDQAIKIIQKNYIKK